MEIEFTWDPEKPDAMLQSTALVSRRPARRSSILLLVIFEDRVVAGELRYLAIGYTRSQNQLLAVAFTDRSTTTRRSNHIISAREAERYEQTTYSDQFA